MNGDAAFIGSIPQHYDQGLGPLIFVDYAEDISQRVAACNPAKVLETAAGTGIVTRRLRDRLPAAAHLIATDLNAPMLEIARAKFRSGEQIEFKPADATALPFGDSSFDAIVCQFGLMFFPDKDKSFREAYRVLAPGGRYFFNVWDSHRYNPFGRIAHEVPGRFFLPIHLSFTACRSSATKSIRLKNPSLQLALSTSRLRWSVFRRRFRRRRFSRAGLFTETRSSIRSGRGAAWTRNGYSMP